MDFSTIKAWAISEGNVVKVTQLDGSLIWEIANVPSESRLPSEYQEVEWIRAEKNIGAYIDLGFTFDTACRVFMEYWIITEEAVSTYPFGATENSGKLRCILSCPYSTSLSGQLYGSTGTAYNQTTVRGLGLGRNAIEIIMKKSNLVATSNGTMSSVTSSQGEYTMTNNLYLFAQNYNGSPRFGNPRQFGLFRYYDKNNSLVCNLTPCYRKSDGVIGMYDLERKMFLTNIGTGSFIAGPIVQRISTNWTLLSINADGSIYNSGTGYKKGYRVRSGGEEAEAGSAVCVGFVPFKKGDTIRIYPPFFGNNTTNSMNFVDSDFNNLGQLTGSDSGYGIASSTDALAIYKTTVIDGVTTLTYTDDFDSRIAYVRITNDVTRSPSGMPEDMIITINEEIPI